MQGNKAVPFAKGFDDPRGLTVYQKFLFVAGANKIWRIDGGKVTAFAPSTAFPAPAPPLTAITADPESGTLYVSAADGRGKGVIFRVSPAGKVDRLIDTGKWTGLQTPTALLLDGQSHLLVADAGSGEVHRLKISDATGQRVAV